MILLGAIGKYVVLNIYIGGTSTYSGALVSSYSKTYEPNKLDYLSLDTHTFLHSIELSTLNLISK